MSQASQMLWVNLIMDTFAAAALASLPPSWAVMKDKPRKSGVNGDFIITRNMALNIFAYAAVFVAVQMFILLAYKADGAITAVEMSEFFTIFVLLQFWNMFNAKAYMTGTSAFSGLHKSASFLVVALVILLGQYLIVTYGGTMFGVTPLPFATWSKIILCTSLVLVLPELWRVVTMLCRSVAKR